jgi:hypothetical protein
MKATYVQRHPTDQLATETNAHGGGGRACGRSLTRVKIECPVRPLQYSNGDLRWDVQDLDAWINSLKAGVEDHDSDAIIARLVK